MYRFSNLRLKVTSSLEVFLFLFFLILTVFFSFSIFLVKPLFKVIKVISLFCCCCFLRQVRCRLYVSPWLESVTVHHGGKDNIELSMV